MDILQLVSAFGLGGEIVTFNRVRVGSVTIEFCRGIMFVVASVGLSLQVYIQS